MISNSHMIGAFYGLERLIGTDRSPVRRYLSYAEENLLQSIPLMYILTVTTVKANDIVDINGLYMGRSRELILKKRWHYQGIKYNKSVQTHRYLHRST